MSNGNGVTSTLSQAAETVKETASNLGGAIVHRAEGAVETVKATATKATKAAKKAVGTAKKKLAKVSATIHWKWSMFFELMKISKGRRSSCSVPALRTMSLMVTYSACSNSGDLIL